MKKVIRLTESDLERIVKRIIKEGSIDKSTKEKDLDVKMETFRTKIKNFLKSKDCNVKQVGTDFEVHCDNKHVGQVMFRRDKITVKKMGDKFGKDFNFDEMGKIKSELSKMF
jgi:ribosome maturation protein Sdo1